MRQETLPPVFDWNDGRQEAIMEILQTASVINHLHIRYLKPFNLSFQQYHILRNLRECHPDSMSANMLKAKMIDQTPNLTRMVDKLLAQKLVTRVRSSKDRRKVNIKITDKGLDTLRNIDKIEQELLRITENLSKDETGILSGLLNKIRGTFLR